MESEYVFLLKKGDIIEYVFYDIKTAIMEAMKLSLTLVRLRVRPDGVTTSMTIYQPLSFS